MFILVYPSPFGPRLGLAVEGELVDVRLAAADHMTSANGIDPAIARAAADHIPDDVGVLFAGGAAARATLQRVADHVASASDDRKEELRRRGALLGLEGRELLPPVGRFARLWCAGLNFQDHISEVGLAPVQELPGIHLRAATGFVGHNQALVRPKVSVELDWEVELAIVIGKPGRYIDRADALSHIGGYTIMNEGTLRDYQWKTRHSTPGKNFDHAGSLGPWIATADAVADPDDVVISTTVNGETKQRASTAMMIFDVATLISFISEFTRLQPGDLITTGSPEGTAFRKDPPPWLQPGDEVTFSADGVGTLENVVVDEVA